MNNLYFPNAVHAALPFTRERAVMDDRRIFIVSYTERRAALEAAAALGARGGGFRAARSPAENGEWTVYATGPTPRAEVERCRRFLRAARFGEPASW